MRFDSINRIEERTPKDECERDSYSSAKYSKRVSWNMIESDVFVPSGYRNDNFNKGFLEPPIDASRRMTEQELILQPTRMALSPKTERLEIDAKTIVDHRKHGKMISLDASEKNELDTNGSSMNMNTRTLHVSNSNAGAKPLIEEEPMVIRRDLLKKISRLKQAILTIRNYNSAQKGKYLIHEYQLRLELEALCEDVFFLGEKKDRLAEALRDLQSKSTEILMRHGDIESKSNNERKNNENVGPKKTEEDVPTRFSDACVQTEDWPTT